MADRSSLPPRPLSEAAGHYYSSEEPMTGIISHDEKAYELEDIDMEDTGPSTAPSRSTGVTFFHDD